MCIQWHQKLELYDFVSYAVTQTQATLLLPKDDFMKYTCKIKIYNVMREERT